MQKLKIEGGKEISGTIVISGSKNATLPILASTILTNKKVIIKNIPIVRDVETMADLLTAIGSSIKFDKSTSKAKQLKNFNISGNQSVSTNLPDSGGQIESDSADQHKTDSDIPPDSEPENQKGKIAFWLLRATQ